MKTIRTLLAGILSFAAVFFLSGCFQAEQVINVKPDGTGTVVMTVKMSKEALAQMKALGGQNQGDPLEQMLKKEEAEDMAKKMGEGVKLEKVEPYQEGNFSGKRATFSFTDINKLKADMSLGPDAGAGEVSAKDTMKFELTKGNPATLVIHCPNKKQAENKPDDPQEDAQMAAAAAMMKDMRITIIVNVVGEIVSTDADNKEGTRVTMLDLPVGEALKDIKKYKEIDRATDWPVAAKLIKTIPGAKAEGKQTVKVQFK
jgi:hypothetical protein